MDMEKLNELRVKHPRATLEMGLVSGRISPETGKVNENYEADEMQDLMEFCVLEVLDVIAEQGHSGLSHGYLVGMLMPLLHDLPITPLTGADWEWMECGSADHLQNIRCPSVFKKDDVAYNSSGYAYSNDGGKSFYTCSESRKNLAFPCASKDLKTEYVIRK